MTPEEVKAAALLRSLTSLTDLGAQYKVEFDGKTHTNIKHRHVYDWSHYKLTERIGATKAGDTLRIDNLGDDLGKLQSRICGTALIVLGEGGYTTRRVAHDNAVLLYILSSPVKPAAATLWEVKP